MRRTVFICSLIFIQLFLVASIAAQATEETATDSARKRAEIFLQTAREGRWDDLYKYVALVSRQNNRVVTRLVSGSAKDSETRRRIADRYKATYAYLKPGAIRSVRLRADNPNVAGVAYRHEDLDGFEMICVKKVWYRALDVPNL